MIGGLLGTPNDVLMGAQIIASHKLPVRLTTNSALENVKRANLQGRKYEDCGQKQFFFGVPGEISFECGNTIVKSAKKPSDRSDRCHLWQFLRYLSSDLGNLRQGQNMVPCQLAKDVCKRITWLCTLKDANSGGRNHCGRLDDLLWAWKCWQHLFSTGMFDPPCSERVLSTASAKSKRNGHFERFASYPEEIQAGSGRPSGHAMLDAKVGTGPDRWASASNGWCCHRFWRAAWLLSKPEIALAHFYLCKSWRLSNIWVSQWHSGSGSRAKRLCDPHHS